MKPYTRGDNGAGICLLNKMAMTSRAILAPPLDLKRLGK